MSDGITEARRGTYWKSNKYETLENNMEKRNTWTYNDTKVNVPKTNKDYMPNQYKHRMVSFTKSAIRILGFGAFWWSLDIAVTLLILAEIVGVAEELV